MEENLKLSPPWIEYNNELEVLFSGDPDIRTEYDDDNKKINIYVNSQDKYEALTSLLPTEKKFGNVSVYINVVPANEKTDRMNLVRRLFEGNSAFSYATTVEGIMSNPICYVVFKPEVVQYFNDSLHDPNGITSTLMENIARDVIGEDEGVLFSTDKKE